MNPAFVGLGTSCYKEGEHEYALHPFLRAPAADLNVTLAFALVAVVMVEFYGFQALGIGYLGKFFNSVSYTHLQVGCFGETTSMSKNDHGSIRLTSCSSCVSCQTSFGIANDF